MKKQILTLMLGAALFAVSPAFGMEAPLEESQTTSSPKLRLQKKLENLDYRLKTVQNKIQEKVECFNMGGPEGHSQPDPRISALQAKQARIRGQMELCDRMAQLLQSQTARPFNGALLIAEKDKIIFEDARGGRGSPNLQSQFLIGSLSKQITAAMVGYAAQKGLLNLHAPIKAYLPEVNDQWVEKVTLHHLLNHTSGIKAVGELLEFEPGTDFSYSNEAYDLVGKILENVRGIPYRDLANSLFKTLGMNNSFAPEWENKDTTLQHSHLAEGYVENERGEIVLKQLRCNATSNPSDGLVSTVHDLLKWNVALHGGKLLKENTYQQMIAPSSWRDHRWIRKIGYGYGVEVFLAQDVYQQMIAGYRVQINNANEIPEISHGGIISGYLSTLIYYPRHQMSLIILENKILWTDKWEVEDQKKTFDLHDQIRDVVKSYVD